MMQDTQNMKKHKKNKTRVEVRGRPEPLHKGGIWSSMREFPTQRTLLSAVSSVPHPQVITLKQIRPGQLKTKSPKNKNESACAKEMDVIKLLYPKFTMKG